MNEQVVQRFWKEHACGDAQVRRLRKRFRGDYEGFFTDYDRLRYQNERHLPASTGLYDLGSRVIPNVLRDIWS